MIALSISTRVLVSGGSRAEKPAFSFDLDGRRGIRAAG
jgi:hypothetical protein